MSQMDELPVDKALSSARAAALVLADGGTEKERLRAAQQLGEAFRELDDWLSRNGIPPLGWMPAWPDDDPECE